MADSFDRELWRHFRQTLDEFERRLARLESLAGVRPIDAPVASPVVEDAASREDEWAEVVLVGESAAVENLAALTAAPAVDRERTPSESPLADEVRGAVDWGQRWAKGTRTSASGTKISLEELIGGRWFTWLGAALLALAAAFFVPWAWRHFQMPPAVRVAIFHLSGLGLLGAAYWLSRRKLPVLAHGVAGLGIFTMYASAFAMEYHYRLWGEYGNYATLLDCALITAAAVAIAVRYNSVYIVILGALGGYVTPLISARGTEGFAATFSYLAFLNTALLVTATIRPWRFLKPAAVAATAIMFLIWIYSPPPMDAWRVEWMLVLHAALFLAGTNVPPLAWKQRSQTFDLLALVANSLWFVGATWLVFHMRLDQQMASVCWGMAAFHALLFGWTYARLTNFDRLPRFHLALAAVFLTLAVPLQMRDSLNYLAYAWAVEGFVFTAIGVYFRDRQMAASGSIVLMLSLARAAAFDFTAPPETIGGSDVDHRMLVMLGVGLSMMAAGSCYWWVAKVAPVRGEPVLGRRDGALLAALGNVVAMVGLTCQWNSRLVLFLWILDASVLWAAAFWRPERALRVYAMFVSLALVGGRALHHGASLDGPFALLTNERFITLALVGLLYLRAGWFERSCRRRAATSADEQTDAIRVDDVLHLLGHVAILTALSLDIHDFWAPAKSSSPSTWAAISMEEHLTHSVVWAAYGAMLAAFGLAVRYSLARQLGLGVLLAVAAKALFVDLTSNSLAGSFALLANGRFMSLACVAALCLAAGWFERRRRKALPAVPKDGLSAVHVDVLLHLLGNAVMLAALSAEVRDYCQNHGASRTPWSGASMEENLAYSVVWAAYAAALVAAGFALRYRLPRLLGLGGLLAVAAKVVIVDLADILLIYRVLILAALGVLMLVTSFWYQKFMGRINLNASE